VAWMLGPIGALRTITSPPVAVPPDVTAARLGAVHRTLSGRVTVDRLAVKRTWKLGWQVLDTATMEYLDALHLGLLDGALWLVDGQRRNRSSVQVATGGSEKRTTTGFSASTGTIAYAAGAAPTGVVAAGAITWTVPITVGGQLLGDTGAARRPLVAGEQVTVSVYAKGASVTARAVLVPYDAAGSAGTPVIGSGVAMSGSYQRLSVTHTVTSGQVSCAIGVDIATSNPAGTVTTTGWQLEAAASASAWHPGGGAAPVAIESLEETYPMPGRRGAALTLLEV
jgi:hypothetical protein